VSGSGRRIRKCVGGADAAIVDDSCGVDPSPLDGLHNTTTHNPAKPRDVDAPVDAVDVIAVELAKAISAAAAASQWGVVEALARELTARRVERSVQDRK
jgi:hypothetical protein